MENTNLYVNQAKIIYKPWKINLFQHIDWCNRWFNGLINLQQIPDIHSCIIIDAYGDKYIFRHAVFEGFNLVKSQKTMYTAECVQTNDFWILKPNWMVSLKHLTTYKNYKPNSYRDILEYAKLFYSDGTTLKRLINNKRIIEINKFYDERGN